MGIDYSGADGDKLQDYLHFQHAIEVPIKVVQGKMYVRVSVHIYNEMKDYEILSVAVKQYFQ